MTLVRWLNGDTIVMDLCVFFVCSKPLEEDNTEMRNGNVFGTFGGAEVRPRLWLCRHWTKGDMVNSYKSPSWTHNFPPQSALTPHHSVLSNGGRYVVFRLALGMVGRASNRRFTPIAPRIAAFNSHSLNYVIEWYTGSSTEKEMSRFLHHCPSASLIWFPSLGNKSREIDHFHVFIDQPCPIHSNSNHCHGRVSVACQSSQGKSHNMCNCAEKCGMRRNCQCKCIIIRADVMNYYAREIMCGLREWLCYWRNCFRIS